MFCSPVLMFELIRFFWGLRISFWRDADFIVLWRFLTLFILSWFSLI